MIATIKSPFTGGQVELIEAPAKTIFRKEEYSYIEYTYRCVDTGRTFTTDELDTRSIQQVYEQYCAKHGIPNTQEIKEIRQRYGLSALAMSAILGLGENQYRLYEEGAIPSESKGKLIKLVADKNNMLNLLESSKALFSDNDYIRFSESIRKAAAPKTFVMDVMRYSENNCQEPTRGIILRIPFAKNNYYRKREYRHVNER